MFRSIVGGWFTSSFNQFNQRPKIFPLFKLALFGYNKMEIFSCRKSNIKRTITLNKNFGNATSIFLSHIYPWKKDYISNIEMFSIKVLNTENLDDNIEP